MYVNCGVMRKLSNFKRLTNDYIHNQYTILKNKNMETNQILENNKLILNFMGVYPKLVSPCVYSYSDAPFFYSNGNIEDVLKSMAEYAKYNTSWDWLMPVVERCFTIDLPIDVDNHYFRINDALLTINISEVYKAVIEFIKWYNLNK